MNVAQAVGFLDERFGDLGGNKFTGSLKRDLLQNAELDLANKLHPSYLTELQTIDTPIVVTTGAAALSLLSYDVLGGSEGIRRAKITSGKICKRIDPLSLKDTESYYRQGSTDDPMFWVEHNKIYVLPTSISSIDVSFLKVPPPLYYSFLMTISGGGSTTVFLGDASQGLSEVVTSPVAYFGAVIYCVEKATYHVVTGYTAGTRTFTVTPAATGNFTTGLHFRFLTHGFDTLTLSGVNFTLNEGLHEIILNLAEYSGWAQTKEGERRDAAWKKAFESIKILNDKYKAPEQLGTQGQGR